MNIADTALQAPPARGDTLAARRLAAADLRGAARPGAGPARRAAIAAVTTTWLTEAFEAAAPGGGAGIALAAVGSLARGDSGPLSDLDLVLLHDTRHGPQAVAAVAERLWYPLWDEGVRLDHAVRTLPQCRAVASGDLVAAVGMLDIRHVAGDAELVAGVRSALAHDWRANARRRLPELVDAVRARHERAGGVAHALAPELKEARGGLRDMGIVRALTSAWLTERPHGELDAAHERLLDVRDALQLVTGRPRERLIPEEHDAVASLLGLADGDAVLREVTEAGRVIAHGLDATMRRAGQAQRARALKVGPRGPRLTPLGHGLFEHDGEIVLGPRADAAASPLLLLRAARAAARAHRPLAPATLAALVEASPPLPHPWPAVARDLFGELLASGEGLVDVWESLTLAGVIDGWLPPWGRVRSLIQRSPVHRHTVDRHQVQAVVEAGRLLDRVGRPDLLLLATLLHDLGKADGTDDHSATGAPVAHRVALDLGFDPAEADLVRLLVAQHLTLVDLATRRDPQDPMTVTELCEAVGHDPDVLDLLRALTEADARAAGPAAWTVWRERLVDDLTARAHARLAPAAERAAHGPAPLASGRGPGEGDTRVAATEHALAQMRRVGAHVVVTDEVGGQVIEVVAPDRVGLFADVAGLLALHGLTVRHARLATVDGVAVDRWHVESPRDARADAAALIRGLARLHRGDRAPLAGTTRFSRPPTGPLAPVTRALLVPGASADATVLQLRGPDRPGLLYDVARALRLAGTSVRSAHVATYGGQAVDTVYLTEPDGAVLAPARVAEVIGALIDVAGAGG